MRKVTLEDIKKMNTLYLQLHSYAAVSREVGFAASTVKNYIDPNFSEVKEESIHRFNPDTELPEFSTKIFEGLDNYGVLCVMSKDEYVEIKELWKELSI